MVVVLEKEVVERVGSKVRKHRRLILLYVRRFSITFWVCARNRGSIMSKF